MKASFFKYLPQKTVRELERISNSRRNIADVISELRLRSAGSSSVSLGTERITLSSSPSARELSDCVYGLSGGSLYSARDTIAAGYISLEGGVRVGIAGKASYEGGVLVGVSEISSLVFRFPARESELRAELCAAFRAARRGMLIYSPPGGGKTSALRTLSEEISRGRDGLNVALIDERLEFSAADFSCSSADVLSGYRKRDGMEIALRTLAPDVIVIDEIGTSEEAAYISDFVNCGVKVLASVHARDFEELFLKKSVSELISAGAFDCFFGIIRKKGVYSADVKLLSEGRYVPFCGNCNTFVLQ